jgi:predicted CoA-binding protein
MSTRATLANDFLARKRLAVVGVSRDPRDFSRGLFREMLRRGYDLVPVNPAGGTIEGLPCARRVQDIASPVDGALVMTRAAQTEQVVRDCAAAGVRSVWLHRGVGPGAVSDAAVAFCREKGISVVEGECPFMFLPGSGFVHRAHGLFRRLTRGGGAHHAAAGR